MRHSKRILSLFMVVIMTFSVCFALTMTASARDADGYTVVLLDISSSMLGSPLDSLKDVAKRFCASLLGADSVNRIAIVTYATNVQSNNFTDNYSELKGTIDEIENPEFESFWDRIRWSSSSGRGSTNIYDALTTAASLLNGVPSSAAKNIVLMTDGQPVAGATSEEGPYGTSDSNAQYANAIYNLMQEYKLSYNIYTVGFFHGSQNDLATRLLSDINNKGFYDAQNEDELLFMFSDVASSINKQTPKDYDFLEDSYSFVNDQSPNISKKYFTTIFEPGSADAVYKEKHQAGGLCYGFAYTTAAIYNGLPSISRFVYRDGFNDYKTATKIRDLKRDGFLKNAAVYVGNEYDDCITLSDYIKYAYIYQYSQEALNLLASSADDAIGLLNTVRAFTQNDRMGVVVGFSKRNTASANAPGGHEVLAVGCDGNDILIDNPNNSSFLERLTVFEDGTWRFGDYNSSDHILDYAINIQRPYQLLLTGTKVSGWNSIVNKNSVSEGEAYIEGMERVSAEYSLIKTSSSDVSFSNQDYYEIPSDSKGGVNDQESGNHLYWVKDGQVTMINNGSNSASVTFAGDNTVIESKIDAGKETTFTIDSENIGATLSIDSGNEASFSIATVNDDGDKKEIAVNGIAVADTVTVKQVDENIVVEGLNNLNIEYLEDEQVVSSTVAAVVDGREVNISVDNNTDKVTTDFVDETSETPVPSDNADPMPSEKDNKCKYCGEDHGTSFLGRFVAFFHKIAYFFAHLFGKR